MAATPCVQSRRYGQGAKDPTEHQNGEEGDLIGSKCGTVGGRRARLSISEGGQTGSR